MDNPNAVRTPLYFTRRHWMTGVTVAVGSLALGSRDSFAANDNGCRIPPKPSIRRSISRPVRSVSTTR